LDPKKHGLFKRSSNFKKGINKGGRYEGKECDVPEESDKNEAT
jgi:hypothetical protein